MAGGGHGSGEIKYSDYLETVHKELVGYNETSLSLNLAYLINSAVSPENNPWEDVDAFNPNAAYTFIAGSPLSNQNAVVTAMATLTSTLTRALSETTDFNTILNNAENKAGDTFGTVDSDVDSMENKTINFADETLANVRPLARTEATAISAAAETAADARLSGVISDAVAAAESAVTDNLDDLADAYEEEIKPAYMRSVNRFAAGMADIGAVQSSSFVQGMATLEASFMRDVNKFRAEKRNELTSKAVESYLAMYREFIDSYAQLASEQTKAQLTAYQTSYENFLRAYLENAKDKNVFRLQAVREMTQLLQMLVQTKQTSVDNYLRMYYGVIIAEKEKADRQAELDGLETRWPLEATMYMGQGIGSIAGAAHRIDKPTSAAQSALSGALAGGSVGAILGPVGAGVGALVGALGGYFE